MKKNKIIILVKEHENFEQWSYAEYNKGKLVNRYSISQVKELRKNNIIIVI